MNNVRHRIRSVVGCVLRRVIWLDTCSDIGRIENVQWHCHWWSSPKVGGDGDKVYKYMWRNCEGFIFARSDWEYVTNTFIFPVNIGYHFIATNNGAMNGQLCGIGADAANRCIVVDEIQPMGLLITNGRAERGFPQQELRLPEQLLFQQRTSEQTRKGSGGGGSRETPGAGMQFRHAGALGPVGQRAQTRHRDGEQRPERRDDHEPDRGQGGHFGE